MIKVIYSNIDSTIYEASPSINTGQDEILELTNTIISNKIFNSRILIKFDISIVNELLNNNKITTSSYSASLQLKAVDQINIPYEYSIKCYPISESWTPGIGKYFYVPTITNDVSWQNATTSVTWSNAINFNNITGGGSWNSLASSSYTSQIKNTYEDLNLNVTSIITSWLNNTIPNKGFIIKLSDHDEQLESPLSLKYYSSETNTIYFPKLVIGYDDCIITGSLPLIDTSKKISINLNNLKNVYNYNSIERINVTSRYTYPIQTYTTSSFYKPIYVLPETSYYQIVDKYTQEIIIPYSEFTKISRDNFGNYFIFDFSNLIINRFYEVQIKVVNNDFIYYFNFNNIFKII